MTAFAKAAAFGAAIVVSAMIAQPAPASGALSASALKELFPGVFTVSMGGTSAVFTAANGGSLTGIDTGTWTIRGSELCITLENLFSGKTRCAPVIRVGEWYQVENVLFRKR